MNSKTNLVVIGAGPGGYAAAFLAADLGMNVTLIDKEKNPGGVCLYRGCIPSKAFLHVAKLINETHEAKDWGVEFSEPKINLEKLRDWKSSVVSKLTGGLGQLSKQRKINYLQGKASFINSSTLKIEKQNGEVENFSFDKAIIATGSIIATIPALQIKSSRVLNSSTALDLPLIPKSLLVIGGGYIGLELGSVYSVLGTKVSVVEMMPGLLPGADRDLVIHLSKRLEKSFDKIMLDSKVVEMKEESDGLQVKIQNKNDEIAEQKYDYVLMSIGRKPDTSGLGLENTKVKVNQRGWITVNEQLRTDDANIYAIGDIVGEPMLAHKASHEGRVAVEVIAGHKVAFGPKAIPAVVFTDPEIAWAGLTETQAREKEIKYEAAKFPWSASGRATTLGRMDGVTKILIDPETQRILGVGICGPGAGELIAEGVLAIEMGANLTDLKLTIHPHPTLSETLMETAEIFFGQSTHVYRPKR
ncbi:MAG: dihydrolipoyl dehydrogenase [Ignavibacteria bacterium RIFOXYB2_FULL_35_12]|nr:MAG: dihydrolipoyl dehydrogenase [Ignavibacteria bacterium GWA2_36_19]OGU57423.1 MAG: dihydrolipoyl dehydrogenase [Ignavibacteria bacterium GWF2_35_20]OGU78995.1 MAG: dihydrolipoyl dehydrogenase [Ignavibacteria bacterium RIFOXYA2_FULL_35_9]OGU88360.1 MAG: dihydrolipoyl dehydrogenase [Ignavibacteria bacterium RIFOXYC12_FULL_35_11]OGU91569.1 MAG: dihydrolipoyl dehydrogenase [Ignavibacteria bacterium RIFOXYA12_FULL_35_25]OGU97887.1 MAG: dihydrolipoyl dehydrogenase [Ignavibacteria bacterium RIF